MLYPGMTGYVLPMAGKPISLAFSKALLVEYRERAGLTQQELADLCGLTRSQISRWETGENKPEVRYLNTLVRGLKTALRTPTFALDDLLDPEEAA